ncbi:MAG: THxN family PEP-CTERM protein [Spirulina sp.]
MKPLRMTWLGLMTATLALGFTPAVNAASLITSGTWTNATPLVDGIGTDTISWPTGDSSQSSYNFAGVNTTVVVSDLIGTNFSLGTFTHNNFPISGTSLDTATLNVDFTLDTANTTFSFLFDHTETTNYPSSGYCKEGGVTPCPDLVKFPHSTSQEIITIDGVNYNLTLKGFSQDGGVNIVDEFLTLESQSNLAELYAQLTEEVDVPEPALVLALLTLSTLGLGGMLKHKTA